MKNFPKTKGHVDNPVVTAIAYLRVSTDDQQLGPDAQRKAITEFANREKIEIAEWHFDNGVSGATPVDERPALIAAFADIQKHNAKYLLVAKLDRIARDAGLALFVERDLENMGARLASADNMGSGDGPEARLLRTILYAFADYERQMIRMRTKAALAVKKARLQPLGKAPYGSKWQGGKLVAVADEEIIVQTILSLRKSGLSYQAVSDELARHQVFARSGNPFTSTTIRDICRRE